MKKLYLSALSALLMTLTASAQGFSQVTLVGSATKSGDFKVTPSGKMVKEVATDMKFTDMSALSAKNATVNKAAAEEMITERPAGTYYNDMYRSMTGYSVANGYIYETYDDGMVGEMVVADDGSGTVYVKDPVSAYITNTWLKGTKGEGDTVVFKLPQLVYTVTDNSTGTVYKYYAQNLKMNGTSTNLTVNTDNNEVKFVWNGDTLRKVDESAILGLTNAAGTWQGYGDATSEMFRVGETPAAPADPSAAKPYAMTYATSPTETAVAFVKVAKEGNDIYIGDLQSTVKNGWIKGTLQADGRVLFMEQYLGVDTVRLAHTYFFPVDVKYVLADDGVYDAQYEIYGGMYFTYDEATEELSTDGGLFINRGKIYEYQLQLYPYAKLSPSVEKAAKPANPTITSFEEYYNGYCGMKVEIPLKSVDGDVLDAKTMYYRVYINDELYAFPQSIYTELTEDNVTDIPYSFTSHGKIYVNNQLHAIFFFVGNVETIAIQSVNKGGGDTNVSDIVYYESAGINAVTDGGNGAVKSVVYTDLSGRKVATPTSGVYVKSVTYADGNVKVTKVIKR